MNSAVSETMWPRELTLGFSMGLSRRWESRVKRLGSLMKPEVLRSIKAGIEAFNSRMAMILVDSFPLGMTHRLRE